ATVRVLLRGGKTGMRGTAIPAGVLEKSSSTTFSTGSLSTLRLQQVLSQLGYLPLTWTPSTRTRTSSVPAGSLNAQLSAAYERTSSVPAGSLNAQLSAAYEPPAGAFSFKPGYPSELANQGETRADTTLAQCAILDCQ